MANIRILEEKVRQAAGRLRRLSQERARLESELRSARDSRVQGVPPEELRQVRDSLRKAIDVLRGE